MRILLIHSDELSYRVTQKTPIAEKLEDESVKQGNAKECLVVFSAVEKGDEINKTYVIDQTVSEIKKVASQVGTRNIVVYPYAHLSSNLSDPKTAIEILKGVAEKLKGEYSVIRAPFGFYKAFTLSCKGHPMSELSREIHPVEREVKEEAEKEVPKKIKKRFLVLTKDGKEYEAEEYVKNCDDDEFKILVEKEALGKESPGSGGEPEFISVVKRYNINWEGFSDRGHMKYGPEGNLLFELVAEYAEKIVRSMGIPVYSVRGTNMFDLDMRPVREHAELYGDRLYQLEVENKKFVMRYAACHQQFAMIKDWTISYRNLPFGAFEVADSYRMEQSGELLLCFRTRKMHMPDFHVICRDEKEALEWFYKIHEKIYEAMDELGRNYELLINLTSEDFYERNKDFLLKLARTKNKNLLICFYPPGINYYWSINSEYHITDDLNRPREIGTVQIDFGNSRRFGIKYTDMDGNEKYPFILHSAIIGTIERYLFALFDTAIKRKKQGKPPMLPVWISPIQLRIIPVAERHLKFAEELAEKIRRVRVDIDDRGETVARRIRQAEEEWIPYIIVVGDKEVEGGKLKVRVRETREEVEMTLDELEEEIHNKTGNKPFKQLTLPIHISKRPIFNV
ncbi:MAG: threonine--tRNA ligase [Candidatus Jordarchaeaceae archaeon]